MTFNAIWSSTISRTCHIHRGQQCQWPPCRIRKCTHCGTLMALSQWRTCS